MFGSVPGSSSFCYNMITITCNGKSASAQIVDKVNFLCHLIYQLLALLLPPQCPGCPNGGLDLTEGLFEYFAPLGTGVIYCDWTVGGGAPAPAPTTSSTPPPPPTSTSHYDPPPTTSQQSTYSPPPSSSTSSSTSTSSTSKASSSVSSAPPTTTQQSSTSSTTQTSGVNYNNAPASSLAQPTGTITPGQNQSINTLYQAMIGLGLLAGDGST
jgi:hypothetical protein